MLITNKDVIQSYILTTARYDFSVYEKRVMYRLVEMAQSDMEGKKLNKDYTINKTLFDDRIITMPISAFLNGEKDKNYSRIKKALDDLESKVIYYEDDRIWEKLRIIQKPKVEKYQSTVKFEVQPKIWEAIFSFSKGFRKFELKTAMSFESVYSMRFYELFSGQKTPIIYSIENLKIMFQIQNKYKLVANFINRVIIPAKKELDKLSPYSFSYELIKEGRKITAVRFFPYLIPKNRDEDLEVKELKKQISPSWYLDKMIIDYLKQNFLFTTKEINNNIDLFKEVSSKLDLMLLLSDLKAKNGIVKNIKGYVIGTLKKQLKLHQMTLDEAIEQAEKQNLSAQEEKEAIKELKINLK